MTNNDKYNDLKHFDDEEFIGVGGIKIRYRNFIINKLIDDFNELCKEKENNDRFSRNNT